MDLYDRVDEIIVRVEDARAIPMSGSCVVHRGELLGLLDDLRADLPGAVRQARALLDRRDELLASAEQEAARVLATARREADRLVASAQTEQRRLVEAGEQTHARLVSEAEVTASAEREASRIAQQARSEAERMRQEVDEYVEGRLVHFERILQRTLQTVERGRDRLRSRAELGLGPDEEDVRHGDRG